MLINKKKWKLIKISEEKINKINEEGRTETNGNIKKMEISCLIIRKVAWDEMQY